MEFNSWKLISSKFLKDSSLRCESFTKNAEEKVLQLFSPPGFDSLETKSMKGMHWAAFRQLVFSCEYCRGWKLGDPAHQSKLNCTWLSLNPGSATDESGGGFHAQFGATLPRPGFTKPFCVPCGSSQTLNKLMASLSTVPWNTPSQGMKHTIATSSTNKPCLFSVNTECGDMNLVLGCWGDWVRWSTEKSHKKKKKKKKKKNEPMWVVIQLTFFPFSWQ